MYDEKEQKKGNSGKKIARSPIKFYTRCLAALSGLNKSGSTQSNTGEAPLLVNCCTCPHSTGGGGVPNETGTAMTFVVVANCC